MSQKVASSHSVRTGNDISLEIQNIQNISDPAERLKAKQRARDKLKEKLQKIESRLERLEQEPSSPSSPPPSISPPTQTSNGLNHANSSLSRPKVGRKKLHTVLEAPSESPRKLANITKKFDIISFGQPFLPPQNPHSEPVWAERFYWANDGVYLPFPVGYKARRYVHGIEHIMEIQKDKGNQIPVFYVHIPRQDFFPDDEDDGNEDDLQKKARDSDPERRRQIEQEFLDALPENTEIGEKYISFYNKTSSGVWQSVVDYWNIQFRKTNSKHRVSGPLYFGFKEDFVKDELYQMMKNVTQFIPEKLRTKLTAQHVRIPPPTSTTSPGPAAPLSGGSRSTH